MNSTQIERYYQAAMHALGNHDEKTFLRLINTACENNHVDALLQLGFFYRDNIVNHDKMIESWIRASDLGSSDASYNLGREYWRRKDYVRMKKYYDDCCTNGDYDGAYQLACYYRDIDNNKLMEHYINLGIANNNKLCQDLVSSQKADYVYYRRGIESDKKGNVDDAIKYYKQSIGAGSVAAHTKASVASMFNLGLLYQQQHNNTLGMKYLLMACENGSLEAPINIGLYYEKIGDYTNMKRYYIIGIERNCSKCLNQMIKHSSLEKNEDDIIKYTQISADRGNAESIEFMKNIDYSLGMLYKYLKDIDNMKRSLDNGIKKKCIKCCKAMISYMRQIKDRDSIYKYDDILAELEGKQMSQARQVFNESFGEPDESKELGWTPYKDMKFCVQMDFIKNKLEQVVNNVIKETKDEGWLRMTATLIMGNLTTQQSCIIFKNKDYLIGARVVFRKKGTRGIYTSFNSRHFAELLLNKTNKKCYMVNFYSDDWEQAMTKPPVCVIYSIDNMLNCIKPKDLIRLVKIKTDYILATTYRAKSEIYDLDFFPFSICDLSETIIKCTNNILNNNYYFIIYHKNESHEHEQIESIIGDKEMIICNPDMIK